MRPRRGEPLSSRRLQGLHWRRKYPCRSPSRSEDQLWAKSGYSWRKPQDVQRNRRLPPEFQGMLESFFDGGRFASPGTSTDNRIASARRKPSENRLLLIGPNSGGSRGNRTLYACAQTISASRGTRDA